MPGGTYYRNYGEPLADGGAQNVFAPDGGPTDEADPATVSEFRMDKYLVTVGRFRQFVTAWNNGYYPANASGLHAHLNGGLGLAVAPNVEAGQTYEQGWDAADWNNVADIDPTTENLTLVCSPTHATWTSTPGSQETLPINCVDWYEAYAFCIWDGGFLPSEAEWEYVAAGGSLQLEYPWGSTDPGTANQYAIYDFNYTANPTDIAPVGTATLGAGYWGQLDMGGEVWEWNLDWYAPTYVDPCTNCAYLTTASYRVIRGGYFGDAAGDLMPLPGSRYDDGPTAHSRLIGFRCARTPS